MTASPPRDESSGGDARPTPDAPRPPWDVVPRPTRVLVCGHVTVDRYGRDLLPGGSAYYAGQAHAALGAQVAVFTAAGPDFPSGALTGVEAHVTPAARTTAFENRYASDGRRSQRVEVVAPVLDPAQVAPAWRDVDLLHLAPILGEVDVAAWRLAVRARLVGLGLQGCVRALLPDGTVAQPRWEPAPGLLAGVGAACLGEDDLVGQGDLLDRLAAEVPIVAFTHGASGCDVIVRGRTWRVGVHRTTEVEPTGAGDVFAAGFLLALAWGWEPVEAARLGAAAASVVVEGRAGAALPRVAEAHARRAAVPVLDDAS